MQKKHRNIVDLWLMIIVIAFISGCSSENNPSYINSGKIPHINGNVKSIIDNNGIITLFIEGDPENQAIYDSAFVGIDLKTSIFRKNSDKYLIVTAANIKEGDHVIVYFTGPIATSSPIHAKAIEIIIE